MKKSFVLYCDIYEIAKDLKQLDKADLFDAIFLYSLNKPLPKMSALTNMAFGFIKQTLDRDKSKWNITRKARKEAGRKGGLKRAENEKVQANATLNDTEISSKSKQVQANQAVSVNGSVNVSVNDTNEKTVKTSNKEKTNSSYLKDVPVSLTPEFKNKLWAELEVASQKEVSKYGK